MVKFFGFVIAFRWWLVIAGLALVAYWIYRRRLRAAPRRQGGLVEFLERSGAGLGVVSTILGILGFFYSPVTFVLKATATDLLLNMSSDVTLWIRQKEGTESAAEAYPCNYFSVPAVSPHDWNLTACKVTVTNTAASFASGTKSPLMLTVSMPHPRYSWEGPATPIKLTLYNIAQPRVEISQGKYRLGASVAASVTFGDGPAPQTFTCSWTPADYFAAPEQCRTTFVVPRRGSALQSPSIDVSASIVIAEKRFETKRLTIGIDAPPANLLQIVLDTSGQMGAPLPSKAPFFNVARSAIVDVASAYAVQGGWLSIIGFGDAVAPPNATSCRDKVGSIYSLSSVDRGLAEKNLGAITVAGVDAPLASAIRWAADEYQNERPRYADKDEKKTYVFAVITAGGPFCDNQTIVQALQQIGAAFNDRGLSLNNDRGSLSFLIVKGGSEAELTYRNDTYREQRTILLVVRDDTELKKIVKALGDLFNIQPEARKAACQQLIVPLERLVDTFHVETLKRSRPCANA